jgi:hypothetical protein
MTFIRFFNQIKTTNPIPRCIDCKYYLLKNSYANNRCSRVIYKCSDTDTYKFEYAYIVRSDGKMCGPKGTSFEPLIRKDN